MQKQSPALSTKSRGILYHFKIALAKHKLTLEKHIGNVFKFLKQKYKKSEFNTIILKYDGNLCLTDIDKLFDELDESKNGLVFYSVLEQALKEINESDNPNQYLNRMSKIKCKNEEDASRYAVLIQIKDILIKMEQYRQVIELFSTEEKGYLTRNNFEQLLQNLCYTDPKKKDILMKVLFNRKEKVPITSILEELGLHEDATRINLVEEEPEDRPEQLWLQQQQSQYIRLQKESKAQKSSLKMKKMNETHKSFAFFVPQETAGVLSIQKIPDSLKNYFNYGSELEEGFALKAKDFLENKEFFLDDENPTYSKAQGFIHIAQVCPNYQLFNKSKSVVQRNRKGLGQILQPKDIKQGAIGDCYFLSALAALVQDYPELVYRLFVLEKNPSHIFGVRLFIEGIWKTIILDGILPVNEYSRLCGAQPHENQIWVPILEKAWAKQFGSYDKINSGFNEEGLVAISGAPTIVVSSRQPNILKRLEIEFTKGSVITCSTSKEVVQLTQKQQEEIGVFAAHAYTILRTYIDIPYRDKTVTLLKVRNPWGKKGWKKDWSFGSSKWTKELREMMEFVKDPKDGTFFISYEDFTIYFDNINISKLNLGYFHSWVTNQGSRYQFYENRLTVKDPGDYFFTIYQQNPRRYKYSGSTYKKSKSYLFLAKIEKQTQYGLIKLLKTFACKAAVYKDNTLETTLEPGNYILLSSVIWNHHDSHPYNITAYGPGKVTLSQGIISSPETLKNMIDSRAQMVMLHGAPKINYYEKYNISKSFYCSLEQGFGFLAIKNLDYKMLQTQIVFQPCLGINFLMPYFLPLQLTVLPQETIICSFLISPQGYNYQSKEKYSIHKI